MIKKNDTSGRVNPVNVGKKIRKKALSYQIFWSILLALSGLLYLASTFTVVDYPSLFAVASSTPISFSLITGSSSSIMNGGVLNDFHSLLPNLLPTISVLGILVGGGHFIITRNSYPFFVCIFLSGGLLAAPKFFDEISMGNKQGSMFSQPESAELNKIEFGELIQLGDVKGYINSVGKYSVRAEFVINTVIENKAVNQDDAINLIDALSKTEAQNISVGLAETIANAVQAGEQDLASTTPIVAALAAYTLSATGYTHNPVIDERTGYAIFDAAMELNGFEAKNSYSEVVSSKVEKQISLQKILINLLAVSLGLTGVFLLLWGLSFRNVHRVKKAFIEEEKLRNVR